MIQKVWIPISRDCLGHSLVEGDIVVYTGEDRQVWPGGELVVAGCLGIVQKVFPTGQAAEVEFGSHLGETLTPIVPPDELEVIDHIDANYPSDFIHPMPSLPQVEAEQEFPIKDHDLVVKLSGGNSWAKVLCKSCGHVLKIYDLLEASPHYTR